jgi:hypothetical protein
MLSAPARYRSRSSPSSALRKKELTLIQFIRECCAEHNIRNIQDLDKYETTQNAPRIVDLIVQKLNTVCPEKYKPEGLCKRLRNDMRKYLREQPDHPDAAVTEEPLPEDAVVTEEPLPEDADVATEEPLPEDSAVTEEPLPEDAAVVIEEPLPEDADVATEEPLSENNIAVTKKCKKYMKKLRKELNRAREQMHQMMELQERPNTTRTSTICFIAIILFIIYLAQ